MKKKHINPAKACTCSVCKQGAHSIQGTTHRRCSGVVGGEPRKHQPKGNRRGTWQPGIW